MFGGQHDSLEHIEENNPEYFGYCLIRSNASILHAFLSERIIIREKDTYAYLVCKTTRSIPIAGDYTVTITGFPYVEKDRRGIMCAQASLGAILEFWDDCEEEFPSLITTASGINKALGIPPEEFEDGRGLSLPEMVRFLEQQNIPHNYDNYYAYTEDAIRRRRPETNIYGYMDSKFPVCAIVKTVGELHALTLIGHTFDRHDWLAMADQRYYLRPLSGDGEYHSNLNWVRNFMTQDDNFGMYFFLPWKKMSEILLAYIVPLPDKSIRITPLTAERLAYHGLVGLLESYSSLIESEPFHDSNLRWAELFLKHARRRELVLRPFYLSREALLEQYQGHDFYKNLFDLLNERGQEWYAVIEVSWPDLYCYQRLNIATVVIDPFKQHKDNQIHYEDFPFFHLPGLGLFTRSSQDGEPNPDYQIATHPDPPTLHNVPSGQHIP